MVSNDGKSPEIINGEWIHAIETQNFHIPFFPLKTTFKITSSNRFHVPLVLDVEIKTQDSAEALIF